MQNPILNLQDRLQKLIEQYNKDKAELDELREQNARLTEENQQLFVQMEEYAKLVNDSDAGMKSLAEEHEALKSKHQELEKMLTGIESFATAAISTIDTIIPLIEEGV